jgi:hypothetical protein
MFLLRRRSEVTARVSRYLVSRWSQKYVGGFLLYRTGELFRAEAVRIASDVVVSSRREWPGGLPLPGHSRSTSSRQVLECEPTTFLVRLARTMNAALVHPHPANQAGRRCGAGLFLAVLDAAEWQVASPDRHIQRHILKDAIFWDIDNGSGS